MSFCLYICVLERRKYTSKRRSRKEWKNEIDRQIDICIYSQIKAQTLNRKLTLRRFSFFLLFFLCKVPGSLLTCHLFCSFLRTLTLSIVPSGLLFYRMSKRNQRDFTGLWLRWFPGPLCIYECTLSAMHFSWALFRDSSFSPVNPKDK